jgi:hypothetical protein
VAAAVSFLLLAIALTAFLPITVSVFAYAFVEARNRKAWTAIAPMTVHVGGGPYRAAEIVPSRLLRAPLLVRAAALGCFYWSWFCVLAWVTVGIAGADWLPIVPLVVVSVAVALGVGRAGVRLLRRDPRAVSFARRVAVVSAAHATLVVVLAFVVGGSDWSGVAVVFGVVTFGQAALLVAAVRDHAPLFAWPRDSDAAGRPLPSWLARMLARRAQRRANLVVNASQTSPGA